ncbi:hypothetical protein [Zobellella maritima]|uniref:hypothetical protein n=1 Tax=Zobellella maritima TaxID=2059725 RepID=UPI000E3023D0|nr:hypothetical protein [Zobellella maritima]
MQSIIEFERVVDYIYGVYLDSTTGFDKLREWFEKNQNDTLSSLKNSHPELASIDYLDSVHMIYGKGDPNTPEAVELHRCTQKEYKERNSIGGINFQFLGNMALVSLYQYWEDYHRAQVAAELGKKKNDLKAPIMGDLRRLRISIIHHGGIALKEVEKCELVKWYKEGDTIFIDKEKFEDVIFHVKNMLNELKSGNA